MSENILRAVQTILQDAIAPDVRELKVEVKALGKLMETKHSALEEKIESRAILLEEKIAAQGTLLEEKIAAQGTFLEEKIAAQGALLEEKITAQSRQSEAQFNVILAAIREAKAQSDLLTVRLTTGLSERISVLESRRN